MKQAASPAPAPTSVNFSSLTKSVREYYYLWCLGHDWLQINYSLYPLDVFKRRGHCSVKEMLGPINTGLSHHHLSTL